jgi:glycosyltransferase involved in cell wall biosynthesis
VLFVGRLSQSKNVDVLLAALADARVVRSGWRAVIAGDGPERARLERLAREHGLGGRVTFAGAVPFDRVLSLYEEASILVLASNTEGWPKAITEAMAFGAICIGSDCGLVPRILGDGRGVVVPARDVHALAAALNDVLTDTARFAPMRERAARWAQQYTLESVRRELGHLLSMWWDTDLGDASNPLDGPRATARPRWTQ